MKASVVTAYTPATWGPGGRILVGCRVGVAEATLDVRYWPKADISRREITPSMGAVLAGTMIHLEPRGWP